MKRKADAQQNQSSKKPKLINEQKNSLSSLPDELVIEILSYLNEHELRWIRLIDQQLFNIVNMSNFNIGVVLDSEMSKLTRVFGRYNKPIGLTFRNGYQLTNISFLTQLTQLTSLYIDPGPLNRVILSLSKLTNLQSFTSPNVTADHELQTRLTELVVHQLFANDARFLPSQLQRFEVGDLQLFKEATYSAGGTIRSMLIREPQCYENCFKAMPNLTHLKVSTGPTSDHFISCYLTGLQSLSTSVDIIDLPVNTMTALTIEKPAHWNRNRVPWDITHLTKLRHLALHDAEFTRNLSLIPFPSLESLTLPNTASLSPDDLLLTQLSSSNSTQLNILSVDRHYIVHIKSLTKLRQLSLGINGEASVDLSHLSHLTHLTSLTLKANNFKNLNTCTSFKNLKELQLDSNQFYTNEVMVLTSLTRLTRLSFPLSHPIIDVSNMTNLQSLEATNEHVPISLYTLRSLTSLCCFNLDFTCSTFPTLQRLDVRGSVSDNDILLMSTCFTRLTSLTVKIVGSGEHLTRLTQLQLLAATAEHGTRSIEFELKHKLPYCYVYYAYDRTRIE